jgi:fibronectin type 3 domain-containing protein
MVRDQGGTGSCTAWATGYYGKTFQEVQEEGWHPDDNAFSPAYLYAMQCRTYDEPWDIMKAWEILNRHGVAKWGTLPFEDLGAGGDWQTEKANYADLEIPQAAHQEARIFRCGEITQFNNLEQIKHALTQGPVLLAINKYESPPDNAPLEENYMRPDPNNTHAGHAILCVGYDNEKFATGALKFVNSWGSDWGENGYCWIRYPDTDKLVVYAMAYKDIPNPDSPDNPENPDTPDNPDGPYGRPASPSDVSATDDVGNYVDVTWSLVPGAQYYRVFRAETQAPETYTEIGTTYQGDYRDYPVPGVVYYYSVVAVNDIGESDHQGSDTDQQGHVDSGSAIGETLATPSLKWEYNDEQGSRFTVSDIDPAATTMEVFVSKASEGPWDSLGWAGVGDFTIQWGANSEYGNKNPYVRIRVANETASSQMSEAVQVGEDLDNTTGVAAITEISAVPQQNNILLRWLTDGGKVDFYEVWRYCASADEANEWVMVGYSEASVTDDDNYFFFEDQTPLPGVPYYYAVVPVYQGSYGEIAYTQDICKVEDSGSNLHLTSFSYHYGYIPSPTDFPEIVVRNDGSTPVQGYAIAIVAYDWAEDKVYPIDQQTREVTLEAGDTDSFALNGIEIPEKCADGHMYSWGIFVDPDNEISETYEDDNRLWSTDGWQLATNPPEARSNAAEQGPRIGSTRPFSHKKQIKRGLDAADAAGDGDAAPHGQVTLYNGPSSFHRPDFCNDHSKTFEQEQ